MDAVWWIVLAIALAIGEAFTASLLIIFFSVGALAAAGSAALGADPLVQVIAFALGSGFSLVALRPIVVRHARAAREIGADQIGLAALTGSKATVLEQVGAEHGMIRIDGEIWQARSFDEFELYLPGEQVRVMRILGATAIVWRDAFPET